MTLTIGGVDITPFIAFKGLKYTLSDVDAPNAGRSMDATMHRARVASKMRLDITCRPLKTTEVSTVLQAIYPEWVTVVYTDPRTGSNVSKTMYSNNRTVNFLMHKSDHDLWMVESFPLVER